MNEFQVCENNSIISNSDQISVVNNVLTSVSLCCNNYIDYKWISKKLCFNNTAQIANEIFVLCLCSPQYVLEYKFYIISVNIISKFNHFIRMYIKYGYGQHAAVN